MASVDADDSNSVEFDEIPALLVFEFFRGDQDQAPQPVQLYRDNDTTVVATKMAPAWFTGMDYNGDGDISRREFLGTQSQFEELDQDGDGFLIVGEIAPADDAPSSEVPGDEASSDVDDVSGQEPVDGEASTKQTQVEETLSKAS